MKSYILGLVAAALAIAFSSFGTSRTNKLQATREYYAVKSGTSFVWVTSQPDLDFYECVSYRTPYCWIVVPDNFIVTDGVIPSQQTLLDHSTYSSQWEEIL